MAHTPARPRAEAVPDTLWFQLLAVPRPRPARERLIENHLAVLAECHDRSECEICLAADTEFTFCPRCLGDGDDCSLCGGCGRIHTDHTS